MKAIKYSTEIKVPNSAIDELNHVNNIIYLTWVQKISAEHWNKTIPKEIRNQMFWVVLNHNISYKNPAFEGEELILTTWVAKMQGVKSERRVEIKRKSDDKIIVEAKTLWCLIDAKSKKPKRIDEEITKAFIKEEE